jgi:hypothetical protein
MIAPEVATGVHRSPSLHLAWQLRLLSFLMISGLMACGGGGGSGSQPSPPPTPDFSLAVSPTSQIVNVGSSASVSLSATAINGFSSQVTVQVSGLPTGVSVSSTSITLTPGTPQQVNFSAEASAAATSQTVTFTGVSGSLTHAAKLSLSVAGSTSSGPFTAGRTKYVRTDATTEYFQWVNLHWIVYNPITNYFYVTDPDSNHVMVLDAASETEVGEISVPGAYSIDDTSDHTTLYIGTAIGDLYTVDPVAMTVTNRYVASQIGPSGYDADAAVVLADGRVALLHGTGGITGDGFPHFAVWNPSDNSLTTMGSCSFNIGGFSRSTDRTKIILSSVDGGGLCEVDESTGQTVTGGGSGFPGVNFRTTADGNYIIVPANTETLPYAYVYDAATLSLVTQIPVSGDTSTGAGFAISADSTTLFVPNDWMVYAYDLASGQQVGWLPNIDVPITIGGGAWGPDINPNLQAVDGTGLLAGPMEEGIGFIDTTAMRTGAVGSEFPYGFMVPGTGPTSGGTPVQISEPSPFGTLSGVYFGSQGATNISGVSGPDTYGNFGSISATSPPGKAGPVDIYAFITDGGFQLLPEGFSYGPTVIEVTPNMSTGEGGGTGVIYGYGFGPVPSGTVTGPLPNIRSASSSVPSSLQVSISIAGNPAQVTGFAPYAYDLQTPPFPLQALAYTIPPGTAAADVTITSTSGSTTAHSALSYLPAIQEFSLPGSSLAQGIYDPHTSLYYFTDANKIQVFSRAQGVWQSPINIPAPNGAQQRLWGVALSPDGSKLAISDAMADVIYVLDPATPGSVQTFSANTQNLGNTSLGAVNPCGVAISDAGMVYFAVFPQYGGDVYSFFKLDTNTGKITSYDMFGPGVPDTDIYLRTVISSDNSRVFFNSDGAVFYIDTATDAQVNATLDENCCYGDYDLALSANQSQFEGSSYLYDLDLNAESYFALNDREIMNIAYVYGVKFSADGTLLFQPTTNGIDVMDGRLGNLLNRIALSVSVSQNYDALVSDDADSVLIAITGTGDGIAIVDLTSIMEPSPLPYARKLGSKSSPDINWRHTRSDSGIQIQTNRRANTLPSTGRRVPHVTKPIFSASHPRSARDR